MPNQITSTPKKTVPKRQIKFTKQIRLLLSEDMFDIPNTLLTYPKYFLLSK